MFEFGAANQPQSGDIVLAPGVSLGVSCFWCWIRCGGEFRLTDKQLNEATNP